MRKDIESDVFPYSIYHNKTNAYFIISKNGEVKEFGRNKSDKELNMELFNELTHGKAKAYAAWVGRWKTDLFEITDINRFLNENIGMII